MNCDQLDAIIRIGAVTAILSLAWLLLRHPRQIGLPAILFAPLALCLSGFVIGNTPAPLLRLTGILGAVVHDASGFTVVFLWWFCLSCFDKRFRPRGSILAVGLVWSTIAAFDRGRCSPSQYRAAARSGASHDLHSVDFDIAANF